MKVLMVSFISSSNLGDQLIVKTIDENLLGDHEVIKYDYQLAKEENQSLVKSAKNNSFLKEIYVNHFRKTIVVDKLRDAINKRNARNNPNWEQFKEDLSQVDLLVFGGGNAIFDLTKHSSSYYMFNLIVEEAIKLNVPTFACSIGIGPFMSESQLENTVSTLSKCTYVTVRDRKSYTYLKDLDNAELSIDPVFDLSKVEKRITSDKKTIGLSIIDLINNKQTTEDNEAYIAGIVALIEKMDQYRIVLYSSEPKDYKTVDDIYAKVKHLDYVEYEYIDTIDKLLNLYAQLDLVIGARMHSLIVAVSQNIPIIGLSWQPKVRAMFDMIDESDAVFEIKNIQSDIQDILSLVEARTVSFEHQQNEEKVSEIVNKYIQINYDIIEKESSKRN